MSIENSLIGSYCIGTKEEIKGYVSKNYIGDSNLNLMLHAQLWLTILSRYVLPNNVENYVFVPLMSDLTIRMGAGVYNSVKGHIAKKRNKENPKFFNLVEIDPAHKNPGLAGRVRELIKKVHTKTCTS